MQAKRDAIFEIELAFERRRGGAALTAGDPLGERADLGSHGFRASVRRNQRCERSRRIDRRVRQMAGGVRLEAVLENTPAAQIDRRESDAAILYKRGIETAARLEESR